MANIPLLARYKRTIKHKGSVWSGAVESAMGADWHEGKNFRRTVESRKCESGAFCTLCLPQWVTNYLRVPRSGFGKRDRASASPLTLVIDPVAHQLYYQGWESDRASASPLTLVIDPVAHQLYYQGWESDRASASLLTLVIDPVAHQLYYQGWESDRLPIIS